MVNIMATKTTIQRRLTFRESALEKLYAAYEALADGGVKSYTIDDRELTRLDLDALSDEIKTMESEIDSLEAQLSGKKSRRAVGILPRDW